MLSDSQRAALARRLRRGREDEPDVIPRRPPGLADLPLSSGQEQLWFIDRFAPGLPTYNIPVALGLTGPLDSGALGRAVCALAARHEALRTRLVAGGGGMPVQVIDPPKPVPLGLVDLSGTGPGERQRRLHEIIHHAAMRPFVLAEGPLLRPSLLRLGGEEHVLLVVVHHTVFDGWSARVLAAELAALYEAEILGKPSDLPELPVQFADYAVWERGRLVGPALAELTDYWRTVMEGFETIRFPTDRPRPALEEFEGGLADHKTDLALLRGLRELSRREGTTLFVTLLAGLLALLHRYTGQTDLTVGTFSANRGRAELAPLIGFLVNTLPIRADLSGDPAFTQLLARVKAATVGAYAHQDLPFGMLVETLRAERDLSRARVFQIALSYAEHDDTTVSAAGAEFAATDLVAGINAAKFDLDFLAEVRRDGLWFECSYKSGLFEAATIRRLLGNLEVVLRGAVADPSARVSQLPLLTRQELHAELVEWNETAADFGVSCVHREFEAQVARTPDGIAAQFEDERLSYAELNRWANQIARRLRGLGVGPEVLVGVCMPAGLRRLAGLLAIWKAGGGYVPLDPALPAQRLSFMMADAGMAVVLADDSTLAGLPGTGAAVVSLDAEWPAIRKLTATDLAGPAPAAPEPGSPDPAAPDPGGTEPESPAVSPGNVAYVIYTSGSTGRPKGVVVEHRQAVNFLQGMIRFCDIGSSDVVLQFASLSFDASVHDMFMPLLAGARVLLAPAETLHSPPRLAALMREARVTFTCLTPSVLSLLAGERFGDLRMVMAGGEELPAALARQWVRPGLRLVNDYGPTEATVSSTVAELTADTQLPPPIGWPLPNYQAYVLDTHLNPVPVGVVGEMHIGGAGVARGYLNRPELTRERFIPDPFTSQPGARLYKTGDLARRRPDGGIVFAGRIDSQVKVRGLRIELGEIETALASHPAIAQAVAVVVAGHTGEQQLAVYARPRQGAGTGTVPDAAELRAHLARSLPAYMLPAHLITMMTFPLNTSGKVDRSALPAPDPAHGTTGPATPATETESLLIDLYARVLDRQRAGATDSFFDLGGSSLQVMRLVDVIYHEIGVDMAVTTVFLHPAPRQLAARIDAIRSGAIATDAPGSDGAGPLVELGNGVGELSLYLIHAVGGTVFGYAHLARELAGTFKVYGLQAPGLTAGAGATASSLTDLVAEHTQRIRAAQPAGPYRLAGWSMGGVLAFEVARRLERAGAEVALLALLDAPFALPDTRKLTPPELAHRFLADAAQSLGWDAPGAPAPGTATVAQQLAWLAQRLGAPETSGGRDSLAAQLRRRFEVFQAHHQMLAGYRPTAPPVRAPALIVSADHSPNAPARARWPRLLSGPVSTVRVDGDHYTFLRPPLAAEVGTSILKWQAGPR